MEYYSSINKNEMMPFVAIWMDLETIILSEVSHTVKDKYMVLPICGILKKKYTNELIDRTETDSQTLKNLWLPKGECGGKVQISRLGLTYMHYYI